MITIINIITNITFTIIDNVTIIISKLTYNTKLSYINKNLYVES